MDHICIKHANTHNLKDVSVDIPRNQLVVLTGVSGSGKSSLAFDTIYAEGQRRYVDSLSTYARQFTGQLAKPDVESIEGLSPAIAIDQKTTSNSPRSTVGTVTEVLDFVRLLYAKVGDPYCPECGGSIQPQSVQQMVVRLNQEAVGTKLQVLAPLVRDRKGDYNALFQQLIKEGFNRVRIDGEMTLLDELPEEYRLERHKRHRIELVVDRLILKQTESVQLRLHDALTKALKRADGFASVLLQAKGEETERELTFSEQLACLDCDISFGALEPRTFSFNDPLGACPDCQGTGLTYRFEEARLIPDRSLSLKDGAIPPLKKLLGRSYRSFLKNLAQSTGVSVTTPWNELSPTEEHVILYGMQTLDERAKRDLKQNAIAFTDAEDDDWSDLLESFDGVIPSLERRARQGSFASKKYLAGFLTEQTCPTCEGARLKPFALAVRLGDQAIHTVCEQSIDEVSLFFSGLLETLDDSKQLIAFQPLKEVNSRLSFLKNVGLGYLSLDRRSATLSGGEAQRIRLASQIGSQLSGVLYVLDEPSIGLHPQNTQQLIETLKTLRDQGNSLLVVEHDEETIAAADTLIDIGPRAGVLGGELLLKGSPAQLKKHKTSLTGAYLSGTKRIDRHRERREGSGESIRLEGATLHNLKGVSVDFPLGKLTCVTGLSGSGKSSLVFGCLERAVEHALSPEKPMAVGLQAITGLEHIDKLIPINQSPIGRNRRSNPATYTGLFDTIRTIFAATETAKIRGYGPNRFSFNVKGGRCEPCQGNGRLKLEMSFLPNASVLCHHCNGQRFNAETLEAAYQGKSIADVLNMSIAEAVDFFETQPSLQKQLKLLVEVGLDYIQLGQAAPTLSGGEAQRLKLATELMKRSTGKTLYLLDEPTIGLHWADLDKLLVILHKLVDAGNTVVVIEHNLDLMANADWLIEMGPEPGDKGGQVIATGTPEELAQRTTATGECLAAFYR